jgi:predicted amidohydrolase YtcJ
MTQADTIWTGGVFLTMDPARPLCTALAARQGRILAAGPDAEIEALAGPGTRRVAMHGRFAMPGLVEAHSHPLWGAARDLFELYVGFEASVDDLLVAVRARAAETPPGQWITGGPWRAALRADMGDSPRALLDAAAPQHKVALADVTQHAMWCNTAALAAAGLHAGTPTPAGGVVEREPDGQPNGILAESGCAGIRALTRRSAAELAQATDHVVKYYNALGYTAAKEAMATEDDLAAYAEADRAGRLTLHMAAHIGCSSPMGLAPLPMPEMTRLRDSYATENLHTGFAKLFLDGVPPALTASLLDPYPAATGYDASGHDPDATLLIAPGALAGLVSALDAAGFTVKMHAVGDNAARRGLDAIEAARQANGATGLRHEIAHCTYVDTADKPRFAALGAVAEMSPKLWMPNPGTAAQRHFLGTERAARCCEIRLLLEAGAELVCGTDWPAAAPDANPWTGLAGMLTRTDPTGRYPGKVGPGQEITLEQALPIYTVNGARSLRLEGQAGQLTQGAFADFIVLPGDLRQMTPDRIAAIEVAETVWKGQTVHAA